MQEKLCLCTGPGSLCQFVRYVRYTQSKVAIGVFSTPWFSFRRAVVVGVRSAWWVSFVMLSGWLLHTPRSIRVAQSWGGGINLPSHTHTHTHKPPGTLTENLLPGKMPFAHCRQNGQRLVSAGKKRKKSMLFAATTARPCMTSTIGL